MCKITYYYGQWTACNVGHYNYEREARVKVFILILPPGGKFDQKLISKNLPFNTVWTYWRRWNRLSKQTPFVLNHLLFSFFFLKHALYLAAPYVALCQLWADRAIHSFTTTAHKKSKGLRNHKCADCITRSTSPPIHIESLPTLPQQSANQNWSNKRISSWEADILSAG